MRETIADMFRQEGEQRGVLQAQQQTLVRLLRRRFGDLPADVEQTIQATRDVRRLEKWLDQFATAEALEDVGISPREG